MFCPKCGTENPDDAQLCKSCGWVLPAISSPVPVNNAPTSGWAIAALVCGILAPFTCGISAILAIIFGIIALIQISKSRGAVKGNGLAIAGIAIPLVLLPLIVLFIGILIPVIHKSKEQAQMVFSANNMRQIVVGLTIYADDHGGKLPKDLNNEELFKYMGLSSKEDAARVFESPRKPRDFEGPSYIYVPYDKVDMKNPADSILLYENPQFCKNLVNAGFADGHVDRIKKNKLKEYLEKTYEHLGIPMPDIVFEKEK